MADKIRMQLHAERLAAQSAFVNQLHLCFLNFTTSGSKSQYGIGAMPLSVILIQPFVDFGSASLNGFDALPQEHLARNSGRCIGNGALKISSVSVRDVIPRRAKARSPGES